MNERRVSRFTHCCHFVIVSTVQYVYANAWRKWQKCRVISSQKRFADLLESGKHRLKRHTIMEDPHAPQSREILVVSCGWKASIAGLATISCPARLVCCRSCMTGVLLPVSRRRSLGSVSDQSIWDLWWKKWRRERLFLRMSRFSTVSIIKPSLRTYISVIYHRRYVILVNDHTVKKYTSLSLSLRQKGRGERRHILSSYLSYVC
jgi:hypothetical protein